MGPTTCDAAARAHALERVNAAPGADVEPSARRTTSPSRCPRRDRRGDVALLAPRASSSGRWRAAWAPEVSEPGSSAPGHGLPATFEVAARREARGADRGERGRRRQRGGRHRRAGSARAPSRHHRRGCRRAARTTRGDAGDLRLPPARGSPSAGGHAMHLHRATSRCVAAAAPAAASTTWGIDAASDDARVDGAPVPASAPARRGAGLCLRPRRTTGPASDSRPAATAADGARRRSTSTTSCATAAASLGVRPLATTACSRAARQEDPARPRSTSSAARKGAGRATRLERVVLVLGDGVRSATLPTILCDEDDVAGNHGATIGSVEP